MTDFPKDIKDSIKTCLLSIFWPKDEIIDFFKNNSCTNADLNGVIDHKTLQLKRVDVINIVFENLLQRTDKGIGQYRSMLQSLIKWNTFDNYYFHELNKLDEDIAKRNISHLKQLQEIRDARIKNDRINREKKQKQQNKVEQRDKVRKLFTMLFNSKDADGNEIGTQKRGYLFEDLLQMLFEFEELTTTEKFKYSIEGEQIDGRIKYEGENYIVEAKWNDNLSASNALYQFSYKVEGKMYGRGVFISINGFSPDSVRALCKGKALKTILIDGGDLTMVVEGFFSFRDVLDKKIIAAQTTGDIYFDISTGKSKIKL